MQKIETSFVVLTWNRSKMLKICLSELAASIANKDRTEIIILDNNSSDDTRALIDEFASSCADTIKITTIYSEKNRRLNAYKELFSRATGDIIVEVDDDVLALPKGVDLIFHEYFNVFRDYGFLCLDVVQNEHTNGAKPPADQYREEARNGLIVQHGPTGGWCSGFRRKDFMKISILFRMMPLSMKRGEDGALSRLFSLLRKKSGVIKDRTCFHASGPYYSKQFSLLERDIEKYRAGGLSDHEELYASMLPRHPVLPGGHEP